MRRFALGCSLCYSGAGHVDEHNRCAQALSDSVFGVTVQQGSSRRPALLERILALIRWHNCHGATDWAAQTLPGATVRPGPDRPPPVRAIGRAQPYPGATPVRLASAADCTLHSTCRPQFRGRISSDKQSPLQTKLSARNAPRRRWSALCLAVASVTASAPQ